MLLIHFPFEICVQRDLSCLSMSSQPRCPAGCCQLRVLSADSHLPANTGKAFPEPVMYFFFCSKNDDCSEENLHPTKQCNCLDLKPLGFRCEALRRC